MLALRLNEVLDHFELMDSRLLGITTDNTSLKYSMSWELQSTLQASRINWPAMRNHIPCLAHDIQHALGAFMRNLGLKGRTKSWETHERDPKFGENESTDIGISQRLRKKKAMQESSRCQL